LCIKSVAGLKFRKTNDLLMVCKLSRSPVQTAIASIVWLVS